MSELYEKLFLKKQVFAMNIHFYYELIHDHESMTVEATELSWSLLTVT